MKPGDEDQLIATMMRKWPQAAQRLAGDHVAAEYAETLAPVAVAHALAGVETLHRDGEKWPPTAGEILQRFADMVVDPPDFGQVKAALCGQAPVPASAPELPDECAYGECDGDGIVIVDWTKAEAAPCRCRPQRQEILRQRRAGHPLVALFLQQVGTIEVTDLLEDRTAEAQVREKWLAFLRGIRREVAYHGLDPAGLPQLERLTSAPTVRQLTSANGPRQLDPAAVANAIGGAA